MGSFFKHRETELPLSVRDNTFHPACHCYYAMSGTNVKKNQKFSPYWTTALCSIQPFSATEFTPLSVILPDVLSSITACGIFLPFLFFTCVRGCCKHSRDKSSLCNGNSVYGFLLTWLNSPYIHFLVLFT